VADVAAAVPDGRLVGRPIPEVVLPSTAGRAVRLEDTSLGDFVLFIYPRIWGPDDQVSEEWLRIPGARGCTAESCEFRDLSDDFSKLGLSIYGLSTQSTADQAQAVQRLRLSYPLLSDPGLTLQQALGLPTFTYEGRQLYRRSTLVVHGGAIAVAQLEVSDAAAHPRELLALLQTLA
jgi:peroxiredoxin